MRILTQEGLPGDLSNNGKIPVETRDQIAQYAPGFAEFLDNHDTIQSAYQAAGFQFDFSRCPEKPTTVQVNVGHQPVTTGQLHPASPVQLASGRQPTALIRGADFQQNEPAGSFLTANRDMIAVAATILVIGAAIRQGAGWVRYLANREPEQQVNAI